MTNKEVFETAAEEIEAIYKKYKLNGFYLSLSEDPMEMFLNVENIPIELFKGILEGLNQKYNDNLKEIEKNLVIKELEPDNKLKYIVLVVIFCGILQIEENPSNIKLIFKEMMIDLLGNETTEYITNVANVESNITNKDNKDFKKYFPYLSEEDSFFLASLTKSLNKKIRERSNIKGGTA